MERFVKICICLTLFLAPLVAWAESGSAPRPRLKLSETTHSFGEVNQGSKVVHDFVVENTGDADLIISKIIPGCGCTAASASSDPIVPGSKNTIHVEFDTSGFSGQKTKDIMVYTNDIDNTALKLALQGKIVTNLSIEPDRVVFGEVPKGTPVEAKEVKVTIRPGAKTRIESIKSYSKYVQIQDLGGDELSRRFKVNISADAPRGDLRDRAVITLKNGNSQSVNLPIFASIVGQANLKPASLSLGIIEGSELIKRAVKLENRGALPGFAIKEIKSSDPNLVADYKVIKEGKVYVINIQLDPTKVKRDLRAAVDIVTNQPEENPITLNVYGIVPPKA